MEKFIKLTSGIIPLNVDNVDTDMIIPAQHLKSVDTEGYGKNLFSSLKSLYPDFILNNPKYNSNQILVSKANFGCGSSREHAAWAIKQYGIKVIIAESFGDIFYNNSMKNGLLLIQNDNANQILQASLNDSSLQISIDLENQEFTFQGEIVKFDYPSFRKHCLLNGLDDLDYLLSQESKIKSYEQKQVKL